MKSFFSVIAVCLFSLSAAALTGESLIKLNAGTYIGSNVSGPFESTCAVSLDGERMVIVVNFITPDLKDPRFTLIRTLTDLSVTETGPSHYDYLTIKVDGSVLHFSKDGRFRFIEESLGQQYDCHVP